jgi:hypothetical protein
LESNFCDEFEFEKTSAEMPGFFFDEIFPIGKCRKSIGVGYGCKEVMGYGWWIIGEDITREMIV